MEEKRQPPNLQSSVHRARDFYRRCNALPLYDHAHRVFKRAVDEKIVEGRPITDYQDNPERAWMNSIIGESILYHVIKNSSLPLIRGGQIMLPLTLGDGHPLRNDRILKELDVFSELTRLDRRGAEPEEYEPLLNNGRAPLALLARLADYAVTHKTEERTPEHVSESGPLISIFRMYDSMQHAEQCLKMDAAAGERLYAPIAELFGYPELAGDILRHAFRINHPVIHAHVMEIYEDPQVQEQLRITQAIARRLARRLKENLKKNGFDVRITLRHVKHEGKAMRKFLKELRERHSELEEGKRPPLEEYVHGNVFGLSLGSINDPVALKVVLDSFMGQPIDKMKAKEQREIIKMARMAVNFHLAVIRQAEGYSFRHTFVNKDNGYKAHHYDSRPIIENGKLPIETQVKTREWDEIASHGKAAHYYYIGGEKRFIDTVANAYHEIIHREYGETS